MNLGDGVWGGHNSVHLHLQLEIFNPEKVTMKSNHALFVFMVLKICY